MSDWERHREEPAGRPSRRRRPFMVVLFLVALGLAIALAGPGALDSIQDTNDSAVPDDIPIENSEDVEGGGSGGGNGGGSGDPASFAGLPGTVLTGDPLGEWRTIAEAPLAAREHATAVWTGTEVVVVGGRADGAWSSEAAAWDPVSDTWRPLPPVPLTFTDESSAVWTGSEVVVVGSRSGQTASYNPEADRWRALAAQPTRLQGVTSLAWDGAEVIVVGPVPSSATDTAAVRALALDPKSGTWRRLAAPPVRGFGVLPQVAVVNGVVVALGRAAFAVDGRLAVTRYDGATDTWSQVEAAPFEERTNTWLLDVAVDPVANELVVAGSVRNPSWQFHAAAWSPDDGWRELDGLEPGPHRRPHVTVVPAGPVVVFPVSVSAPVVSNWTGRALNAWVHTIDGWRPLPQLPPAPRPGASVVWTGQDLFLWSGKDNRTIHDNGFRWRARDRTVEYCCSP